MPGRPVRYRKKPVKNQPIRWDEAMRWDGSEECQREIVNWSKGAVSGWFDHTYFLEMRTREGVMRADKGDWIIKGVQGEFYPCKPEIFEATYEAVNRDAR
jgi:hypothetical protein